MLLIFQFSSDIGAAAQSCRVHTKLKSSVDLLPAISTFFLFKNVAFFNQTTHLEVTCPTFAPHPGPHALVVHVEPREQPQLAG